jgi:septal ring factor EnvC (AmiA/AmiB activator)
VLDDTRAKKNTLQGDVTTLDAQIKKAETEIKQRNVTISTLGSEIQEKTAHIQTLESKLDAGHESLAKLLREKNETKRCHSRFIAFSSEDLSDFFADADASTRSTASSMKTFKDLRATREETQKERDALSMIKRTPSSTPSTMSRSKKPSSTKPKRKEGALRRDGARKRTTARCLPSAKSALKK